MFSGIEKKLTKASKIKGQENIAPWIRSIVNHLYWCAVSTPVGKDDLIKAKWMSITNHICNRHTNHDNALYKRCTHPKLTGREKHKKWIKRRKK